MITISVFGEATRSHYSLRPEDWAPATPRTNKRCFINSFHFYPILSLLLDFLPPLISNHTPLFVMSSLALDVVDISSSSRTASLGHQPNTPSPISTLSSTSASHGVHRDVSAELLERGRVKHRKHGDVPYPLKAISTSKWLHHLLSIQTLTPPFCFRQGYCCTWNDRQSLRLAYSSRLHSSSFRAPTEACTRYWLWYRLLDHYGSTTVEGNFSIPFAHISSLPPPRQTYIIYPCFWSQSLFFLFCKYLIPNWISYHVFPSSPLILYRTHISSDLMSHIANQISITRP